MAPFSLKNKFIAPTFENGVNGWTVSGTGASGTVLSTSTAYSLQGTQCLKVSVPAGTGQVKLNPPSFSMILDPWRTFAFNFSVAGPAAGWIYYGFERYKPTTLAFHNQSISSMNVSSTMQKVPSKFDYLGPDNAPFIGGLLPSIYMMQSTVAQDFYFDGFTFLDAADQEIYGFETWVPAAMPQISGSWSTTDSYDYSWTGAVEASVSVATHRAELFVPPAFNRGDTIAVTGTGFPASSTVDIIIGEHWNRPPAAAGVPTDASGNLSTSVTVPHAHEPGPAYIVGKPANGSVGSMVMQDVWTNPSNLSGTVTNYFPNPNGQTLSEDGVRPKHFSSIYEEDVITRASVGGGYRVRVLPAYGDVNLEMAESGNAIGLVDGEQYLIRARVHSDTASGDPFTYIQTSAGNSNNASVGPSPWDTIGVGTGVFDGPCEFIAYYWDEGATVDLDHVSIVEGAYYLMSLGEAGTMDPGSTLDGYLIGLRPGREYQLAGYTEGTFKVRTGTSAGSLTDLLTWTGVDPEVWTGGAVPNTFAIPAGHDVISLEASGAGGSWISIFDYIPYFDGDTPDDGTYTYSWAGTPGDSASLRTAGGSSGPEAQVFVGGTARAVSEIRVSAGGTLIPITEVGT